MRWPDLTPSPQKGRAELSGQTWGHTALGMLKCTPAEPLTVNEHLRPPRFPQTSHTVSRFITPGPESVCSLRLGSTDFPSHSWPRCPAQGQARCRGFTRVY